MTGLMRRGFTRRSLAFSLTLDGHAQTIGSLLRAFPPGAATEEPGPPSRARNQRTCAGASRRGWRAPDRRRNLHHFDTAGPQAPPRGGDRSTETVARAEAQTISQGSSSKSDSLPRRSAARRTRDIALDSDLRAVALMNLGIAEAWALANPESERHLQEGADLARKMGRPYLEVACLAELAFASKIEPFATTTPALPGGDSARRPARLGVGASRSPAKPLVNASRALISWTGEFGEGERWLQRAARALETELRAAHQAVAASWAAGLLLVEAAARLRWALAEYGSAEHLQAQLEGSHALAGQLTSWRLAAQKPQARAAQRSPGLAGGARSGPGRLRRDR